MKSILIGIATLLALLTLLAAGCPSEPPAGNGNGEGEGEGVTTGEGEGEGSDLPCPPGSAGCPCAVDACDTGLVCDDVTALCRAPVACATACEEHQVCDTTGGDAVCLPACDSGFTYDAANDACDPTPSCDPAAAGSIVQLCAFDHRVCDDAGSEATCGDCVADFIDVDGICVSNDCDGLDCAGQGRECLTDATTQQESCGGCDSGHVLDAADNVCVNRVTCADSPCPANAPICTEATLGSDRTCAAVQQCADNQVPLANGSCGVCRACFDGAAPREGVIGTATDDTGARRLAFGAICVCELQPGFFQNTDGDVTKCDADGDGWVSDAALTTINQNGGTSPLALEQACTIRKIDRFELRTDDGAAGNQASPQGLVNVARSKFVTVDDIVTAYGLPTSSYQVDNGVKFVSMVEPAALDDVAVFANRYQDSVAARRLAPYGSDVVAEGTKLVAGEANPLTKACNDDNDDLNFDGVKDVVQTQESSTAPALSPALAATPVFYRMSYFIELDRGFYTDSCTPGAATCRGTFVIAEKRRELVDGDPDGLNLRLSYDDANGPTGLFGEEPYWQQCMRGREPDFARNADNRFNTDFGRWYDDCNADDGTCRRGNPETVAYDGRDPNLTTAERSPADGASATGRWPGMGHHSQFKCVSFASADATATERRPPTTVKFENPDTSISQRAAVARTSTLLSPDPSSPAGDYTLMPCTLIGPTRQSHPGIGGIANPQDPIMSCNAAIDQATFDGLTSAASHPTRNYFIGLRLPPYGAPQNYGGGCIAEDVEWGFLCKDTPVPNSQRAFGHLFCACDPLAAGASCEVGCADKRLLSQRGVDFGAVSGFWMCAGTTASTNGILQENVEPGVGFRLVGGTVPEVIATTPLCATPTNCGSGFKLSAPAH